MKKGIWLDKEFENGPDFVQYEPKDASGEAERVEEVSATPGQRAAEAVRDRKAGVGKPV